MSPVYTFECPLGHQWDEVRGLAEDSALSADPCQTCLEAPPGAVGDIERAPHGRKVVAQVSVKLSGHGFTPKFFPNREQK
jgi:hypothetical protein